MDNEQSNDNSGQASDDQRRGRSIMEAARNGAATTEEIYRPAEQRSSLDMLGELSNRIKALENSNADLRARLDSAQKGGNVEPYDGFVAHVAHVMQKYYFHEKPDAEASDETRKSAFAA